MDLSGYTSLAGLAEAIAAVLDAASRLGCKIYVTGALARDLWLEFGHKIDTGRETHDVDFAIECADWQTFERLKDALDTQDVKLDERMQHRFRHPNGTLIDLIPFGGVERPDRTIAWPPNGNPVMNLVGFTEVAESTVGVVLPGNVSVPVVTLPALAVLKLLAWEDRRRGPAQDKDAYDLVVIGKHYLEIREPRLSIEDEADLIERHGFEDKFASAELLGSDMARFGSAAVREAIDSILEREEDPEGPLELARVVLSYEPLEGVGFVAALRAGFLGHPRP
ncbi:MAG: hypothetical protein GY769_15825 [bacterium]|nr:hypothetical protein [bacterium]